MCHRGGTRSSNPSAYWAQGTLLVPPEDRQLPRWGLSLSVWVWSAGGRAAPASFPDCSTPPVISERPPRERRSHGLKSPDHSPKPPLQMVWRTWKKEDKQTCASAEHQPRPRLFPVRVPISPENGPHAPRQGSRLRVCTASPEPRHLGSGSLSPPTTHRAPDPKGWVVPQGSVPRVNCSIRHTFQLCDLRTVTEPL